nr:PREDICTED: uncharacterized protein LOC105675216 [Linepithema humile]XP_012227617.1 PREDICTED: uncharacterized protein LOC105675216 [Linepithema humile]XP_012227619.1 PREDICTED: uncharacterized protein LOC105675216 [Linepithema humile]
MKKRATYKQSWEFQIENNYWLIKCYRKHVDFLTECKFCNKELEYVDSTNVQKHMKDKHKPIYKIEKSKMKAGNIAWQYLRFTHAQLKIIQCMICCEIKPNIHEAESHVQNYYLEPQNKNWAFKYARQNADNMTCTICKENVTVRANINQLKKHADTHEKYMEKIAKEHLLWGTIIRTVQWIWLEKCYINAENFRAQCKFCKHNIPYITHTQFLEHMKNKHSALHSLEEKKNTLNFFKHKPHWNHIRYINDLILNRNVLECIICLKKTRPSHTNHFPYELKFVSHWALKYARQNVKVANCTLCKNEVNFEWAPENLENHITSEHPEEREKIRQIDLVQRTVHD